MLGTCHTARVSEDPCYSHHTKSRRGESVHHVQASSRPENLTRTPFMKRRGVCLVQNDGFVGRSVGACRRKTKMSLLMMVNPFFSNTRGVSIRDDQVCSRSKNLTRTPCMTCRYVKPRSVCVELSGSIVRVG